MPRKAGEQFDIYERQAWKNTAHELGLWEQFVSLRESLKNKGVSGGSAWLQAARQLGWVHHEDPRAGHMRGEECERCAQFGEGDQGVRQDKIFDEGHLKAVRREVGNLKADPIDQGCLAAIRGNPKTAEDVVAEHNAKAGSYPAIPPSSGRNMVMMPKAMAEEKPRQDISADIEWVVENLAIEGVTPKDAPTARAWSLYSTAKVSQKGLEMILGHHSKMMPTGKQLEQESGFGDLGAKKLAEFESFLDGEEHVGLLGADALQLQSAENTSSERVVSETDLETRRRK